MATVEEGKNFVFHFRYQKGTLMKRKAEKNEVVDARGGVTVAAIVTGDGEAITWGVSKCHTNDAFTKKRGFSSAMGRARSQKSLVTENLTVDGLKAKAYAYAISHDTMANFK